MASDDNESMAAAITDLADSIRDFARAIVHSSEQAAKIKPKKKQAKKAKRKPVSRSK